MDVAALYRVGQAAWPGVALGEARFLAGVRARETDGELHAADLYLAIACEAGDAPAIAAFERELITPLRALVLRAEREPAVVDEVLQRVRVRVLVGEGDEPARIAGYSGRGALLSWLKVVALRVHANLRRDERRAPEPRSGESLDEMAAGAGLSPEKLLLDQRFGALLRAALGAALRALPARERALLRLHYVEGLALDRIGAMYGVHKGTVSRWLAAARDALLEAAIGAVRGQVGAAEASADELESLCASLCSRLELSLSAFYSLHADHALSQ